MVEFSDKTPQQSRDVAALQMKSSRYLLLRVKIIYMLLSKQKLTLRKIWNLVACYGAYYLKLKKSARFPFTISFELSNECNANCVFCRTHTGEIYNQNPQASTFIEKGSMPYEIFSRVIDETKDHLLMAILYVNGEPLIYKRLCDAIAYATENRVASMIATNGIMLSEQSSEKLLLAGLDFIKIAISGFSQETYSKQVRFGNIEKVKQNLHQLQAINARNGNKTIVMVDFMQYDYNLHEILPAREFCTALGFMFNVRRGNPAHSSVDAHASTSTDAVPAKIPLCDWPWKVLTINWNGDVFPCCDYVVWSNNSAFSRLTSGDTTKILDIWNGKAAMHYRKIHCTVGRKAIPVCAQCIRSSITFKY